MDDGGGLPLELWDNHILPHLHGLWLVALGCTNQWWNGYCGCYTGTCPCTCPRHPRRRTQRANARQRRNQRRRFPYFYMRDMSPAELFKAQLLSSGSHPLLRWLRQWRWVPYKMSIRCKDELSWLSKG